MEIPKRYRATSASLMSGGQSVLETYMDEKLQRLVVVKSLNKTTNQKALLDEIKALQEIRSPYVVQLYDVIRNNSGDISGIVSEHCPGVGLKNFIGKVAAEEFLRIGFQLASGIAEIHAHGVIHRDINPNNVIVGALNRLTIIDFGLSRSSDDASTISQIGTSGFMAPELFTPQPAGRVAFCEAIDIFAFASTMYNLATGKLPSGLRKRPPLVNHGARFSKTPFPIDANLASMLDLCWATKPGHRPSAVQLRDTFKKFLLRGRHKALLNISTGPKYLDDANPRASASISGLASVVIEYDGDDFIVKAVSGDLYVNAGVVKAGDKLPGACVITFGSPELQNKREYVTFDLSHPGVEI